jgi:small-conductance mechanosensitive channel
LAGLRDPIAMVPWTDSFAVASTVLQATNESASDGRLRAFLPDPVNGVPGIEFVLALATLVIGWYLSKIVVSLLARPVAKRFTRPSVTRIVLSLIRSVVLAGAVFYAASLIGFQQGDLLLSATVFSAVIALVLAPIVGSIINGLFVLADRPYEIGDMIELVDRDTRGYVEDMTLRYTKMFTLDNTFMVIPNSSIRERDVINYSAEDERTRLSLDVVVTYEGDLDEARSIMERAAARVDDVITGGPDIRIGSARYPAAPTCYIDEYGDHGVNLRLRYWAKKPYKLLTIRSQVQEEVWSALEDSDVSIAYPHSHVVFDETSGQASVAVEDGGSGSTRRE